MAIPVLVCPWWPAWPSHQINITFRYGKTKPETMNSRNGGIVYFLLGIYALMVSWYYNHSILLLIVHYIFWPIYLVYELLTGHLSHGLWRSIPESYFK
jgi:hypothetical protein